MTYRRARVAVVVPAYNEERKIGNVLAGAPSCVDDLVVVNDGSTDRTANVVRECARLDDRIHLLDFEKNRGVGAAIASAVSFARELDCDVLVTVDGDGQMAWEDLEHLIAPIVEGRADLAKGNRLLTPAHWPDIPKVRLFGNAILSLLTKIASGYWSIADSQSGYMALSRYAVDSIAWDKLYPSYGRENDMLVRANVAECRVADVPTRPVYGVGERSGMRISRSLFTIPFLLFRRFWWRLFHKYVLRDFHPLVFFYLLSVASAIGCIAMAVHGILFWVTNGFISELTAIAVVFMAVTSMNALFFAFWMDMQVNASLAVRLREAPAIRSEIGTQRTPRSRRKPSIPSDDKTQAV